MAEYNLIQAPELLRKLTRKLGLRQGHITPTLAEHVQPVVILDDVRDQTEQTVTDAPYMGYATGAGDAVPSYPIVCLVNPTTSGVVARIRRIMLSFNGTTPANFVMWPGPANFVGYTASVSMQGRGLRVQTSSSVLLGQCQVTGGKIATGGLGAGVACNLFHLNPTGNDVSLPYHYDFPPDCAWTLNPGQSMRLHSQNTDGTVYFVSFLWTETAQN